MAARKITFDQFKKLVGAELGVSDWITVDQTVIDQFADSTRDHQWIHVDVERAKRESPFGAPIAHGFLTLSLISGFSYEIGPEPEGLEVTINYGLDKVRFLAPVRVGDRLRLRKSLLSLEEKDPGRWLMKSKCVMEIEGEEKPALIAETLTLFVTESATAEA